MGEWAFTQLFTHEHTSRITHTLPYLLAVLLLILGDEARKRDGVGLVGVGERKEGRKKPRKIYEAGGIDTWGLNSTAIFVLAI